MNYQRVAASSFIALVALGCARETSAPAEQTSTTSSGMSEKPLPAASPALASLYDLDLALVDQAARSRRLRDFRGEVLIVSMFYASCPYACPTLISDIKRIEARLDDARRARVRVLLVTLEPARDTPERLTELARLHGVDQRRWTFASVPEARIAELAAVLGIKYRALPDGGFNHTSVITVLDASGRTLAQSSGLGQDNGELVRLLSGES